MKRLMLLLVSVLIVDVLPASAQWEQRPLGTPPPEVINDLKHFQKKMEELAARGSTERNLKKFSEEYMKMAGTPSAGKAPYAGPPPVGPYSGGVDLAALLEENFKNAGQVVPHIMDILMRPFFDERKNSCTAHQIVAKRPCIKCVDHDWSGTICTLYAITFSVVYRYPVEEVETTQNMYDSRMATKLINNFSREFTYGKGRDFFGAANKLAGGGGIVLPQSLRMTLQAKSDIFKYWAYTSMAAQAKSPTLDLTPMRNILMEALKRAKFNSETWEKTGQFWDAHKHLRGLGASLGGTSRSVQTRIAPDLPARWFYENTPVKPVKEWELPQFILYITPWLDWTIKFDKLPLTCHTNLNPKKLQIKASLPKMASSESLFVSSAHAEGVGILPMPGGFKPAVDVCKIMGIKRGSPLSILCDLKATDLVRPAGTFEYSQWPWMAVFNNTAKPLKAFAAPFLTLLKKPDLCRIGGKLPNSASLPGLIGGSLPLGDMGGMGNTLASAIIKGPGGAKLPWNQVCLGKLPEPGKPSTTGFKLGDFASLVPEGPKIAHLYSSISGIMKMEKAVRKDDGDEEDVGVDERAFYKAVLTRLGDSGEQRKFKDLIQVLSSGGNTPDDKLRASVFTDMKCIAPEEIKDNITNALEGRGLKTGTFDFAAAYRGILSESSDILNREPGNTFVHWRSMNCCPMNGAMPWDDYVDKHSDPLTGNVITFIMSLLQMDKWDEVKE